MMSNEEWQRKMEFLLNQQAKFDAEMYELKDAQAKTERTVDRAAQNISHLAGFIHEGFGLVMNLFKETDEKFKEMAASSKETDAKIQALTAKMDRHLSEDHGRQN